MREFDVIALSVCLGVPAHAQSAAGDLLQLIRNNDLAVLKKRLVVNPADAAAGDACGTTLLIHAAAIGSPEAVKLLLDSGADPNAKNQMDETALILGEGDVRTVQMLVEKGSDVNAASKLGRTPLMTAAACDGR